MSSRWGCLGAVAIGGVGLVLFALGLDPATTEAMPFGAVLTSLGLFVGVPSLEALRAAVLSRGAELELKFSGDVSARLKPEELNQYALEKQVGASWFVGQRVNGVGKLQSVFSRLRSPHRVEGSLGTFSVYFPYDGRGGELICLDELETKGPALQLR